MATTHGEQIAVCFVMCTHHLDHKCMCFSPERRNRTPVYLYTPGVEVQSRHHDGLTPVATTHGEQIAVCFVMCTHHLDHKCMCFSPERRNRTPVYLYTPGVEVQSRHHDGLTPVATTHGEQIAVCFVMCTHHLHHKCMCFSPERRNQPLYISIPLELKSSPGTSLTHPGLLDSF